MAVPLILARTFQDAHRYAKDELGLSNGYYRVVNSPGTIKAVRGVDLHLVPGWDKRPDRFTMKGAIRYCRLNIIDVEKVRESQAAFDEAMPPAPEVVESTDENLAVDDRLYSNDERTHTIALRYNALLNLPDEPVAEDDRFGPHGNATTVSLEEALEMQDPALAESVPVEKPKARRRRKCAECEQLHYKGDPCIESEDS